MSYISRFAAYYRKKSGFKFKLSVLSVFMMCFLLLPAYAGSAVPENIRKYNYYVNLAEIALIDTLYESAVLHYDSAFFYKDYSFAVDKYNAAVCHVYLVQYEKAYPLLKELLQKGYSIENLQNKAVFDGFFLSARGKALKDFSANIDFTYNAELRSTIDSLFYMDQLFRRNREFGNPYDFFEDTINRIDDSNRIVLDAIVEHYGFPGEEIIGLSDSSLVQQPYYIMLLHFQQISTARRRGEVKSVSPMVLDAYYSGRMRAHEAAFLLEASGMNYGNSFSTFVQFAYVGPDPECEESTIIRKETPWGFFKLSEEENEKVNAIRTDFGLESVDDLRKKLVFQMDSKPFDFSKISGGRSIYHTSDYEQFKRNTKVPLLSP